MSSAEAVASVRAHGIRTLSVDVPPGGKGTPVSVRIYSIAGRLVRVLVDETMEPGSYIVGWDGEDASGRAVQPGVYIAVMTAGAYRGLQRLLIK
jgi:flagellar hook assembly protein FlgD